jgi:hypothetical protein
MVKGTVVLHSSKMSLGVVRGSCNVTSITSSNDTHEVIRIKAEEGVDIDLKQEELPVPVPFPAIKTERD